MLGAWLSLLYTLLDHLGLGSLDHHGNSLQRICMISQVQITEVFCVDRYVHYLSVANSKWGETTGITSLHPVLFFLFFTMGDSHGAAADGAAVVLTLHASDIISFL